MIRGIEKRQAKRGLWYEENLTQRMGLQKQRNLEKPVSKKSTAVIPNNAQMPIICVGIQDKPFFQ
jgi:hypothetical protein